MGALGFFTLVAVLYLFWIFYRIVATGVPKTDQKQIQQFQQRLPEGFGYPYFLDGTGFGINVEENKIYLVNGNVNKIYDLKNVREIQVDSGEYETNKIFGHAAPRDHVNVAIQNRKNKKNAFDNSGIFINVADIDHPRWQIKFSDSNYERRCYEILLQFLNGQLKPYSEYMKTQKSA